MLPMLSGNITALFSKISALPLPCVHQLHSCNLKRRASHTYPLGPSGQHGFVVALLAEFLIEKRVEKVDIFQVAHLSIFDRILVSLHQQFTICIDDLVVEPFYGAKSSDMVG